MRDRGKGLLGRVALLKNLEEEDPECIFLRKCHYGERLRNPNSGWDACRLGGGTLLSQGTVESTLSFATSKGRGLHKRMSWLWRKDGPELETNPISSGGLEPPVYYQS